MQTDRKLFGTMPDGRPVEEVTLRGPKISCSVITYGASLRTLLVPDRNGNPVDVLLGMDTLEGYRQQQKYLGAIVGRFANRIGGARFTLDGKEYVLEANDGPNQLHGSTTGYWTKVWTIAELTENAVLLTLDSPDMDAGYPGNLAVQVRYTVLEDGLEIKYHAETDKKTLCNLTNHAYFNLNGHASGAITDHIIQLNADYYTPTDPRSIPTGEIAPVAGTPMDLRTPRKIGDGIDDPFEQLSWAGGWDNNFVLNQGEEKMHSAAKVWSPESGIAMEVLTDQPGLQFYAGNYMEDCPVGKDNTPYGKRCGFCLETQVFPDAPNHPNFPSAVITPDKPYDTETVYQFGIHTAS